MATAINTDNIFNLESVIGKLVFSHKELIKSYDISEHTVIEHLKDGSIVFNNRFYYDNPAFKNSPICKCDNRYIRVENFLEVEIKDNKFNIYTNKFICPISKKILDVSELCDVSIGYALNEFVVFEKQDPKLNLQPVPYIHYRSNQKMRFVFDIINARDLYPQALNSLQGKLSQHEIELVAHYLGSYRVKDKYSPTDFPSTTFYSKYNGPVPNKISQAQMKKLYELGIVKPVYHNQKEKTMYCVLDEAYDFYFIKFQEERAKLYSYKTQEYKFIYINYYNDHFNVERFPFKKKKEMTKWRDIWLKNIFDAHPGRYWSLTDFD